MEMIVKMTKAEAEQLLKDTVKPSLGPAEFRVKSVEWSQYGRDVEFTLTNKPRAESDDEEG